MCKHILFNNFDKTKDIQTLKNFAARTHDQDGFGAIIRTMSGEIKTMKSVNIASFYVDLGMIMARDSIRTLVVHHRTSTNGSGVKYSHPFKFKGHYLTHNGVVTVPGKHQTNTTNDSEALLHHLIKTNYDTKAISGYFSCFILNKTETIVLVDATAPIYTDGRVYSSHDLGKWTKVELKKLTIPLNGFIKIESIQVTKTDYGYDKAYLSLGGKSWSEKLDAGYYSEQSDKYALSGADDFLYLLRASEEKHILDYETEVELTDNIEQYADYLGVKLSSWELMEVMNYFKDLKILERDSERHLSDEYEYEKN